MRGGERDHIALSGDGRCAEQQRPKTCKIFTSNEMHTYERCILPSRSSGW